MRWASKALLALLASGLSLQAGAAPSEAPPKKVVAILANGWNRTVKAAFTSQLVKTRKVRVVNDALVQRARRRAGGLRSEAQLKKIGRFLKADYLIQGQNALDPREGSFLLSVQATNVKTMETEVAEQIESRSSGNLRRASRKLADRIAAQLAGEAPAAAESGDLSEVNMRDLHDAADRLLRELGALRQWRYEGEIDEERGRRVVHLMLKGGTPPPKGMPLAVYEEGIGEDDRMIGVVYVDRVDDSGRGLLAKWIKEQDKKKKKRGEFGLGTRVSTARYRHRIAVGPLKDPAGEDAAMLKAFRDRLYETMEESDRFIAKDSAEIREIGADLGRGRVRKQNLKELHRLGVDFLITGQFIGRPGRRRAELKLISTYSGKSWGSMKIETRI